MYQAIVFSSASRRDPGRPDRAGRRACPFPGQGRLRVVKTMQPTMVRTMAARSLTPRIMRRGACASGGWARARPS